VATDTKGTEAMPTVIDDDTAAAASAADGYTPRPLLIDADDVQGWRTRVVWADRVRLERLLRRWSQHDLARAAGITQTQVSRLERGSVRRNHDVLVAVAEAFAIPVAELFPLDAYADPVDRPRAG
jgi:DNA-binding XRE family transcriptional regulator